MRPRHHVITVTVQVSVITDSPTTIIPHPPLHPPPSSLTHTPTHHHHPSPTLPPTTIIPRPPSTHHHHPSPTLPPTTIIPPPHSTHPSTHHHHPSPPLHPPPSSLPHLPPHLPCIYQDRQMALLRRVRSLLTRSMCRKCFHCGWTSCPLGQGSMQCKRHQLQQ